MANIAILGYGVVGSGVVELIFRNKNKFKLVMNEDLTISHILVNNIDKHIKDNHHEMLTDDVEEIFSDKVDIVVEAMGGLNPSYEYVKRALESKKHVVTANKDLIAEYGQELLNIARKNGVNLNFEATVGGGIPILKSMNECLVGNKIKSIKAILNGTTNFILTKMKNENMDFETALKIAQKLGFAEANPDSDVLGLDVSRKLSILSTLAFDEMVDWKEINTCGITSIDEKDMEFAKREGFTIKLLGISLKEEQKIYASVRPVMVRENSTLGIIEDEYNAIVVDGDAVGDVVFTGKGAGMLPTASAVFSDISDIIKNKNNNSIVFNNKKAKIDRLWRKESRWLLRIKTDDRIKVMRNLVEEFNNCYILSSECSGSGEVAVFVKTKNESLLERGIEKIKNNVNFNLFKKIMLLEE